MKRFSRWLHPLALLLPLTFAAGPVHAQPGEPKKYALLVGCTEYVHVKELTPLSGPRNDVKIWNALLTDPKGFAFPKEEVTVLVDWPADVSKRPSRANIAKGFEDLIARAEADCQIVILLAGHGCQVPIPASQKDPLDPKNPEPDGKDEVFLPADVEEWSDDYVKNAIHDDQIGAWLDRLREKGAHVLIVFDCCHSGTMTRSGKDVREVSRVADPEALKVPAKQMEDAVRRAKEAVDAAKMAGKPIPTGETVRPRKGAGSLVAFYAAQPFETAPELPFPDDAPMLPEFYHGVLSYTLVQTLQNRGSPLTYGELQRLVAATYRANRSTRPPTPFAEGDLAREVLGMNVWPDRPSLYLQKDGKGKLKVLAGQLHGVTPGSILTVLPPPGDKRDPRTVLGHLQVTSATVAHAAVVPVQQVKKDGGSAWIEAPELAKAIPDSARCEILVRDFGDMRVKLFAGGDDIKKALEKVAPQVREMFRLVPEAEADWVLRTVSPKEAAERYRLPGLKGDHVLLVHGAGRVLSPVEKTARADASEKPRAFGKYPVGADAKVIGGLERDLPRVFKWENLWRLAAGVNVADGGENHGLTLEVYKLKDQDDPKGELLREGKLHDGQEVLFKARNEGSKSLWVTAFYLDANLGIQVVYSASVKGGQTVPLGQALVTTNKGTSVGAEGLVVFAIPQSASPQPDYSMLEQEPLGEPASLDRSGKKLPTDPFGMLLRQAAFGTGTRAGVIRVPSTPAILSQSWVLVP